MTSPSYNRKVTENVAIPPKNAKEKEERRSARRQTATLGSERFRRRFGTQEAKAQLLGKGGGTASGKWCY